MEFLSGGFYKPTIHRVVQPPEDQRGYERLCLIYFGMAEDDVKCLQGIRQSLRDPLGKLASRDLTNTSVRVICKFVAVSPPTSSQVRFLLGSAPGFRSSSTSPCPV